MNKFWVYKDGELMFKTPIDYDFIRLEYHGIDPGKFEIVKKGDEFFWYEVAVHKTRLVYEFLMGEKK